MSTRTIEKNWREGLSPLKFLQYIVGNIIGFEFYECSIIIIIISASLFASEFVVVQGCAVV